MSEETTWDLEYALKTFRECISAGALPDKLEAYVLSMLPEEHHAEFHKRKGLDSETESLPTYIVSESGHKKLNWKVVNARRRTAQNGKRFDVSRYLVDQMLLVKRLCTSESQWADIHSRVESGNLKWSDARKEAEKAALEGLSDERREAYLDQKASRRIRALWKCMLKAVAGTGSIPPNYLPATILVMLFKTPECQNPDTREFVRNAACNVLDLSPDEDDEDE